MRGGISSISTSLTRSSAALGQDSQQRAGGGHHQRGRHAFIGHIADDDAQAAVVEVEEVVEVAADLARRLVISRHVPACQMRHVVRQQGLLDQPGDLKLLLDALTLARLNLLLAHELGHAHGRRGLGRQVVQQFTVVAGVLLLAAPRSQVDHADQFALADQRCDHLYARLAHLLQGRRVQVQPGDVHGAGCALEIGQ